MSPPRALFMVVYLSSLPFPGDRQHSTAHGDTLRRVIFSSACIVRSALFRISRSRLRLVRVRVPLDEERRGNEPAERASKRAGGRSVGRVATAPANGDEPQPNHAYQKTDNKTTTIEKTSEYRVARKDGWMRLPGTASLALTAHRRRSQQSRARTLTPLMSSPNAVRRPRGSHRRTGTAT